MQILLLVMVLSAMTCGFDVLFYVLFFVKAPGYGNGFMTLWPLVYLISSSMEAAKIEGMLRSGQELSDPTPTRIAIALLLLLVALAQGLVAIWYYRGVIADIESGKKRRAT